LLSKDADPTLANVAGSTARHVAEEREHPHIAQLLATSERWHTYVDPLLGRDRKLSARQLVDEAGQPTEALKNLLPNDLFSALAQPDFYREGFNDLALVYPHLPEHVQASIDLTPYRRRKLHEAHETAEPEGSAIERYVRPCPAPSLEKRQSNDEPPLGK
jgi:hypothetical protein